MRLRTHSYESKGRHRVRIHTSYPVAWTLRSRVAAGAGRAPFETVPVSPRFGRGALVAFTSRGLALNPRYGIVVRMVVFPYSPLSIPSYWRRRLHSPRYCWCTQSLRFAMDIINLPPCTACSCCHKPMADGFGAH